MDLLQLDSACDIYQAVESVIGLPSTSASLTDVYVLTCKPGVTFDTKPVHSLFVKLCVSATSLTPPILESLQPYLPEREGMSKTELLLKRLAYAQTEYRVYEKVKQIYYSFMCPFFVRVYGIGFNCTYRQMRKLLKQVKHNFKRNIWYSLTNNTQRLAIHQESVDVQPEHQTFDAQNELQFNLLLLQNVTSPTFYTLFVEQHYSDASLLFKMVFMVGYACYSLNLNNLCHRDLHLKNVFVEPCVEQTLITIVDSKAYKLVITEFPRLFDFDRSKEQKCPTSALDLFYFVSFFVGFFDRDVQLSVAKCFFNISNPFTRVTQRVLSYWKTVPTERLTDDSIYLARQLEPLPKVLDQLSKLAGIESISLQEVVEHKHVYIARSDVVDFPNVRDTYFSRNQ